MCVCVCFVYACFLTGLTHPPSPSSIEGFNPTLNSHYVLFFGGTGVLNSEPHSWLLRSSTIWVTPLTLFCFSYFSDRVSHFCSRRASDCNSACASYVAEDISHCIWPLTTCFKEYIQLAQAIECWKPWVQTPVLPRKKEHLGNSNFLLSFESRIEYSYVYS
jgi:hypothetical protein